MTIYIGYKICKHCKVLCNFGAEHYCPNCGCTEYEEDE